VDGPAARRGDGGVVTRSYATNLRKGRIVSPGYEKLAAIAKAMGFPPEAWFDDGTVHESVGWSDYSHGVAGRVEHYSIPSGTRGWTSPTPMRKSPA
jgi:transcriptional regulator with XRE-family HTH domain